MSLILHKSKVQYCRMLGQTHLQVTGLRRADKTRFGSNVTVDAGENPVKDVMMLDDPSIRRTETAMQVQSRRIRR